MALFAAAGLALLSGCGPFGYLKKVSKDATKAVADAETAGAEQYAPYEYWGAVSYLEQAKVLMTYSEYERSFDYGVRAKQLAEEAKRKSDMREAGQTKETLESAPAPAPAPEADEGSGQSGAAAQGSAGDAEASGEIEVGGSLGGGK